jgi:hypothetical protein
MHSLKQALRSYFSNQNGPADDTPRTVPVSRREKTVRSRRRYSCVEPTPLTEEEVRQLPVAHRYSA